MTNTTNLPINVREEGIFCVWKYEPSADGKLTKVPYNARTGGHAKNNDPSTFHPLGVAESAQSQYDGIGLGIFNGFCAIDIDHCISDDRVPSELAVDIVKRMDSYTEISPSGTGLRILFRAPDFKYDSTKYYINSRKIGLEVYVFGATKRYVTLTGNVIRNGVVEDRTEALQGIINDYMQKPEQLFAPDDALVGEVKSILSDDEVLVRASKANNGAKFMSLWNGDFSALFTSQSEAVASLLRMLAFWTRRDGVQMDRLFRESGLMYGDGKWDRAQSGTTWGALEIQKACSLTAEVYNPMMSSSAIDDYKTFLKYVDMKTVRPTDYTDVGAGRVFAQFAANRAIYVKAIGWLVWNGQRWEPNDYKALTIAMVLTDCMVAEAGDMLLQARAKLTEAQTTQNEDAIDRAKAAQKAAEEYLKFAHKERAQGRINAMMEMSVPSLLKTLEEIDANPFILNTPDGMIDLRDGVILRHDPGAYCSKITAIGPSDDGGDMWQSFLRTVCCDDPEVITFLQTIAGMAAVGRVYMENLIIAHGAGKNGKSTLFNVLKLVLGEYSGSLAPEVLTSDKSNTGANMAELKGKRLVIAAELEEGRRLSGSVLKRVASTDPVSAERKYKDPEDFIPTHTVVLFTNHLPKLSSMDDGTKRRLTIVPFRATIEASAEIKNYAQYLFENCGGAICQWVIDGAITFCEAKFNLRAPKVIADETEKFFAENDWMGQFLNECCEVDPAMRSPGGGLYEGYREWAKNRGDYARSTTDFTAELEKRDFVRHKEKQGVMWQGLMLRPRVYQGGMGGLEVL